MLEQSKPEKRAGIESKLTPAAIALLASLTSGQLAHAETMAPKDPVVQVQEEYKQAEEHFRSELDRIYADKSLTPQQRIDQVKVLTDKVNEVAKRKRDAEWRQYVYDTITKPMLEILEGARK